MANNTIKTIIVCGAGTMGSGIAQVAATAGFKVIQFDLNESMLVKAGQSIKKSLQKFVEKGKISPEVVDSALSNIHYTADITECKGELVIEAIIENKDAKVGLFNQLFMNNGPQLMVASNTSSISIDLIAESITYPSQLVGMHFFNPAPMMKLVEVIKGKYTNPTIVEQIADLALIMQKTPVICKDSPGFIVNRVARPYYLEAMHLVQNGKATIEQVDAVLTSIGFKMGPFKLMDLIGLDINYSVSTIVWEDLGKPLRLKPAAIQKDKIDQGLLGVKTKKGFYQYD
ncbi:MAG TPA: 3-hydroxyacyl-CoA dehydrogenase NAD-binding domain-containing protein [Sediminibacterium sp.]|jgi:3-hydroxybutyryl-CoA dehydrogenase|uniref:3-hydroxyacyl-CoA dehydrogenase family protein n=1 Tax=Sediminibacterium sp. TaxID=1917865 RepID=UPI0008D2B778|nr:3-hydroxyacyl-CoA dehydrogenase NAD-binding domain-containing protein [Sediminibacterium sp.]OHC86161.1 MAG: 3-hydroxybutyryl-CoA dehydrogenase [Sphingobacteriia bacterium RIFOXYC2_FULL_35_18]OHC89674.1 MAG: 3-hydroxybutyryl-CoA dehydrogenase [Sphingobacteriia bacterium RIFOXYD2_FULL_35_12]OYY07854.1 MAG: 3-hydroxybutyryl-CoA dehydrogenase [Sphingobacteriia bacterium 35-36-14]OYZ52287.1 MAG: 3-hydroxybutyryl-CoA dehydrogenase [Sphingobacteriia bacterium 24-36-13]OZA63707.1 MAG: 3-hydroxybut